MQVFLTTEAQKQFNHFTKSDQIRIKRKLNLLPQDPWLGKKLTGQLANLYSLKAWPYRIIYSIEKGKKEIWIISILHRQGAY